MYIYLIVSSIEFLVLLFVGVSVFRSNVILDDMRRTVLCIADNMDEICYTSSEEGSDDELDETDEEGSDDELDETDEAVPSKDGEQSTVERAEPGDETDEAVPGKDGEQSTVERTEPGDETDEAVPGKDGEQSTVEQKQTLDDEQKRYLSEISEEIDTLHEQSMSELTQCFKILMDYKKKC